VPQTMQCRPAKQERIHRRNGPQQGFTGYIQGPHLPASDTQEEMDHVGLFLLLKLLHVFKRTHLVKCLALGTNCSIQVYQPELIKGEANAESRTHFISLGEAMALVIQLLDDSMLRFVFRRWYCVGTLKN
jgi:hypothetical protein